MEERRPISASLNSGFGDRPPSLNSGELIMRSYFVLKLLALSAAIGLIASDANAQNSGVEAHVATGKAAMNPKSASPQPWEVYDYLYNMQCTPPKPGAGNAEGGNNESPAKLKPQKDMIIKDGQKLTLGDTTITMYITPGHTPGTVSLIIPLRDGSERHVGGMWGGMTLGNDRNGVKYFADMPTLLKTYVASLKRFKQIE